MSVQDRNDLIDAYFDAMDEDDLSIVEPALADGFLYQSLSGDLEGFSGLQHYAEEVRSLSNSTHDVTQRVHDDTASVAEGIVTGDTQDGEHLEARFCNVFEFTNDDTGITRLAVYLNDAD